MTSLPPEHTPPAVPPVVCVKTGGNSNGPTWKWIVTTLLGVGVVGASGYAAIRADLAVLTTKAEDSRRDFERADSLLSGVDARHDTAIGKLFQAMHRIEIRQVEMAPARVRDRPAFPPVPPAPAPKPEETDP